MNRFCRHCATPFTTDTGVDGFCCAGCRQVYSLIQSEGLGDYYRKQDRSAQPLKDRALADVNLEVFRRVQTEVEEWGTPTQAVFKVEGMSCMGCVWLVERLASNQPGLLEVSTSLTAHTVRLCWLRTEFELPSFAAEISRFGYRIGTEPFRVQSETRPSPLALRLILCAVFTGNALLLVTYAHYMGESSLLNLLSLTCLIFTLLLGAAPFVLSVYRAAQIRRWHSDWIPVLAIMACLALFGYSLIFASMDLRVGAFLVSLLICILLIARLAVSC
jgi:P-type Cu2+ transporter